MGALCEIFLVLDCFSASFLTVHLVKRRLLRSTYKQLQTKYYRVVRESAFISLMQINPETYQE
jgi:hypothetical protein